MKRSLGFWRSWALVVGIMIGNGIFMLPKLLAPYGSLSLVGWIFAAAGTLFIVFMLASLSRRIPKLGGPYAYTREAFGDLPGYLIAWGYWISLWTSVAAGAVAFTSYLTVFIPSLSTTPWSSALVSIIMIWIVVGVNVAGVKSAGIFQLITTLLKLLPLFIIAGAGLMIGDPTSVPAINPENEPFPLLISSMVMIVMWAYVGAEGITIPADDVVEPEKTIPKALIFGTITVTLVYIVATMGVMSVVPLDELNTSNSPFSTAAMKIFGPWGAGLVAIGAMVSIIGSANGNAMLSGMMPRAIALDGLFPKRFGALNKRGAPGFALIISGLLASLLISLNYNKGLASTFEMLILLSTLTTLLPYTASALSDLSLLNKDSKLGKKVKVKELVIALGALTFSIFTMIGAGLDILAYGLILLVLGLPFYYWSRKK